MRNQIVGIRGRPAAPTARSVAAALAALCALAAPRAVAQPVEAPDGRPVLITALKLSAPKFVADLGPAAVADIQKEAAVRLAALGERWFPYLRWSAQHREADSGAASAAWLAVTLTTAPHERGEQVVLAFSAGVREPAGGFRGIVFTDFSPLLVVHGPDDEYYTFDGPRLALAIDQRLAARLNDEPARLAFERNFLANVCLSDDFGFRSNAQRLYLPLIASLVHAERGSRIELTFKAKDGDGEKDAFIEAEADGTGAVQPYVDHLQASVSSVNCPPFVFKAGNNVVWHQTIDEILANKRAKSARVQMKQFRLNPARGPTHAGLVFEP